MSLPQTMRAMVTMGHGDLDQIVLHEDWARPEPGAGDVLIAVGACGLNNTDVNTRTGWYSKAVSEATTGGPLLASLGGGHHGRQGQVQPNRLLEVAEDGEAPPLTGPLHDTGKHQHEKQS